MICSSTRIIALLMLFTLLAGSRVTLSAQTLVNNGSFIVVEPGAYVVISDHYINRNDGVDDGKVDLDGTMILGRNWINTANNTVITDIGGSPMGNVVMNGTQTQYIEGTHPTHFENLTLRLSDKVLRITDCEVNGRLTLDAVLILNSKKIIVDNPSPDAITYVSKYILSETLPDDGYGEVQWNIGDHTLSYQVPFGSGLSTVNDLNLTLTTTSPGDAAGAISFATYPSGCHSVPYPHFVNFIDREPTYLADRYWIIDPRFNLTKPNINITFRYTDQDLYPNCNTHLDEYKLKAMRYSTLKNMWTDMLPTGTAHPDNNLVQASGIPAADFFAPWTLVNEEVDWEIFFPNAFTPNDDGLNDFFGPAGINFEEFSEFDLYIYNRWGQEIFHSTDPDVPWKGSVKNEGKICQDGVYTWILFLSDRYGESFKKKGIVTLLGK
jgi:gliding motility-associated-like protein